MKKRKMALFILFFAVSLLSGLIYHNTAKAEEASVNYIRITQYPSRLTYYAGESLDFSDMVLTGYYSNGSTGTITDYTIEGYDNKVLGEQTVTIKYKDSTYNLTITVMPSKIQNIKVSSQSDNTITLTWDALENIGQYEVYYLDDASGSIRLAGISVSNNITLDYTQGTLQKIRICAIAYKNGVMLRGEYSDPYLVAGTPDAVTGLSVTQTTDKAIQLGWNAVVGATGYLIYRSPVTVDNYTVCGTASTNSFTDNTPASGTSYKYKVCAYIFDTANTGEYSLVVETSTNPVKTTLKYKTGDRKIRLSWSKITGATSYDIYRKDENDEDILLTTTEGNVNSTYIVEDLVNGTTYSFYAVVNREYKGKVYSSSASDMLEAQPSEIAATSIIAKLFADKETFADSMANTLDFFKKNVKYTKSFVIPGLITTNAGGFSSTSMCPQGLTFADDYILLSAYDIAGEENSVVYVLDKGSRKLLTTLVLPVQAHVGGISYDGSNIWITVGTKVSAFPYTEVKKAVKEGNSYAWIDFSTTYALGRTASYITFYDDKLWVGAYNELKTTKLYSYSIVYEDDIPALEMEDSITMPTRVQGIAFMKDGTLLISRSCQLYKGLRGYMRQIDVYKPDFENAEEGVIPLGDCINSVEMPSMNEEIAIYGSYLYVNFESAAFDNASYRMDRVCAFKLSSIITKPKTK